MSRPSRIKYHRLAAVAVITLVLGGVASAAFVYRRHQISVHFRELRADGMTADAQHQPAVAVNLLGQYLARFPDDVPALTRFAEDRLAVPLPNDGQISLAIPALRYAVHLDPTLQPQRRTLMALYLQTGYWTEALATADELLKSQPPESARRDRQALRARSIALTRLRRTSEATAAADAWCAADSSSVDARLLRLDLAHVVDARPTQMRAMLNTWAMGALTPMAGDLLKGHALMFGADPSDARAPLTAAARDLPFDPEAAPPLERDLDLIGLPSLALEVSVKRLQADPDNLPIRIDVVRREWISQQFQAVVDSVAPVKDRTLLPAETLGLEAVALSELGHANQIGPIAGELAARTDLTSHAWAAVAGQLSANKFEPDKLLAACGPALRDTDGPILRYYVGESYFALGDRQRAALQWERVVATDSAWALPAIHLCQLLTEDGRPKSAMLAGFEAVRRAKNDSQAATALASAWAAAVDAGQDSDIDGCLSLIQQLIKQLPDDPRLPPLQATVLARGGRSTDSAAVIRQALADTRVLPEQTWFDFAATSEVAQLGLEQQCLERDRKEHGITPRSAYARAVSLHFAAATTQPVSPDPGLTAFDTDKSLSNPSASPDLAWSLTRAKYLDTTGNPAAKQAWSKLSDDYPNDANVQQFAIISMALQFDPAVMDRAVHRLLTVECPDSIVYQLARARFDVTFGTTAAEAAESRQLLDGILRQTPDSLEARILSARAYERAGRPVGAITDLQAAVTIDSESVPVRLALARLLQSQGDFSAALDQFDHLDLARLTTDDQRQQAAALLMQHGQAERAIGLLRGPVQSQSPTGRLMLARLYQRTGQSAAALAVIEDLLKTSPSAAAIAFGADLLGSDGKLNDARTMLDRLSELPRGAVSPAIADLIRAEFELRFEPATRSEHALTLLASATSAEATNPTAWHARISAELWLNRPDEAVDVAATGAGVLPEDPILIFFRDNRPAIVAAATDSAARPLLLAAVRDPAALPAVSETIGVIGRAATENQPVDWTANRLAEIARKYPAFPDVDLYLIWVYQQADRVDDSVAVATRAGQSFPDNAAVLRAETETLTKASRWNEVIQIAGKWKSLAPTEAFDADRLAADAMIQSGRSTEVAELLKPYTQRPGSPTYVAAITTVARARVASGQLDPQLGLEPLLSQGAPGRAAWMLFAVESLPPDQAAFDINRAVALMPPAEPAEHVTASEMWMRLADRTGDAAYAKTAADVLQPYLEQADPSVQVLLASASWSEKIGEVGKAEVLYGRVLAIKPDLPLALNNLAMIFARSGRADQGAALMDRAIKTSPLTADLYDTRAFVLWKCNRLGKAIDDINHAMKLDPQRSSFRIRRIQILSAAGQTAEAESALRRIESNYADAEVTPEIRKELTEARAAIGHQ